MIEEQAIVVAAGKEVWVETQRRSTCGQCSVNKGCGTAVLQQVLGNKRNRMAVHSRIPVSVGDKVVLGLDEQALVNTTINVYLLPLGLLILGAIVGQQFAEYFTLNHPMLWSMVVAVSGFVFGYRRAQRRSISMAADPRFRPVILRRDNSIVVS